MTLFHAPRPTITTHLAAIICLGVGLAWMIDPLLGTQGFFSRATLFLAGVGLSLTGFRLMTLWFEGCTTRAHQYFDCLNRMSHHELAHEAPEALPKLDRLNPWSRVADAIVQRMAEDAARVAEGQTLRDETEVRLRRMTAEQEQQREVFEALTEPVLVANSAGELQFANAAAREIFELGDATAVDWRKVIGREFAEALGDVSRRKGGSVRQLELSHQQEGRVRSYRACVRSLAGGDDDTSASRRVLAVFSDITALKAIQKRNADFVSSASHEMKTPLASIKAYTELLGDMDPSEEQTREEFLEVIRGQTERLQRLIDNLLNLARIEAGVVEVHKKSRSLNELLVEAVDVMRPAAEQKSLTLVSELSPLYLGVLADRDTLLQAAINLLSNAIKYTRTGTVTLRSRLVGEEVAFEVEDSGVGLSPEDCEKVFEKFYRVKKDKDMAAGTGLGLPLVKHIVEDVHGGRMEVSSELGKGSTFRVVLPAAAQLMEGA